MIWRFLKIIGTALPMKSVILIKREEMMKKD